MQIICVTVKDDGERFSVIYVFEVFNVFNVFNVDCNKI